MKIYLRNSRDDKKMHCDKCYLKRFIGFNSDKCKRYKNGELICKNGFYFSTKKEPKWRKGFRYES